jgi:hypothetical protein
MKAAMAMVAVMIKMKGVHMTSLNLTHLENKATYY